MADDKSTLTTGGDGGGDTATDTTEGQQQTETATDANQGQEGGKPTTEGEGGNDDSVSYELKAPEGVEIADDELQAIVETAKELKLSNDQAQALVNLKTQWHSEASDKATAQLGELAESWQNEVRNDPEFGGDKFDASLQDVKRVMDSFADDELKSALDETGFGNHPQLFRFIAKIGNAMREDGQVTGSPSSAPRSMADVLYGNKGEQ